MKKLLPLLIICQLFALAGYAQVPVFTNVGAGNNFYSNAENWTDGLKPVANDQAQFNATATLDESATLTQIRSAALIAGLSEGEGVLTLTGAGLAVDIQQQAPSAGGEFLIDANVLFTSTEVVGQSLFRVNGEDGIITFGPNSDLNLGNSIRLVGNGNPAVNGQFNFNGVLRGTGAIQVGARASVTYGESSDNSNFKGDLVFVFSGATVTANNAANNVFVPVAQKIQINNSNGTLILNGANIYRGGLTVGGANTLRLEVNANQPNIDNLQMSGAGELTIALGDDMDMLHFGDLSGDEEGSLWNAGATITIENFQSGAIRFGTNSEGLTAAQINQINIGGGTPSLNTLGYLIDQSANTAPESTMISNLTLQAGFSTREVDLSAFFSDPQNDSITFSATSSADFVTVGTNGNILTISEGNNGTSTITVICTDEFDLSSQATFDVVVTDAVVDSDGDGVPDDNDQCPDTPSGESVGSDGCSDSQKDTDSDGVTDDVDLCPDTSAGATVDSDGCSDAQKDTDADGVNDDVDLCPDTASGAIVDSDGCADTEKDSDGDGVTDDLDLCPNTETGANVDASGCIVLYTDLAETDVYVYPNPVQNFVRVMNINKWVGGTLQIQDMSGKKVLSQKIRIGQSEISVGQLKEGRYIIQLQNDSLIETLTFIRVN